MFSVASNPLYFLTPTLEATTYVISLVVASLPLMLTGLPCLLGPTVAQALGQLHLFIQKTLTLCLKSCAECLLVR